MPSQREINYHIFAGVVIIIVSLLLFSAAQTSAIFYFAMAGLFVGVAFLMLSLISMRAVSSIRKAKRHADEYLARLQSEQTKFSPEWHPHPVGSVEEFRTIYRKIMFQCHPDHLPKGINSIAHQFLYTASIRANALNAEGYSKSTFWRMQSVQKDVNEILKNLTIEED